MVLQASSTIGGGKGNRAGNSTDINDGACSVVVGGCDNSAESRGSVVVGGTMNTARGPYNVVGGGSLNVAHKV